MNSYSFTFPATGHGASGDNACPTSMVVAFLRDPSRRPDDACIATMPPLDFFILP